MENVHEVPTVFSGRLIRFHTKCLYSLAAKAVVMVRVRVYLWILRNQRLKTRAPYSHFSLNSSILNKIRSARLLFLVLLNTNFSKFQFSDSRNLHNNLWILTSVDCFSVVLSPTWFSSKIRRNCRRKNPSYITFFGRHFFVNFPPACRVLTFKCDGCQILILRILQFYFSCAIFCDRSKQEFVNGWL